MNGLSSCLHLYQTLPVYCLALVLPVVVHFYITSLVLSATARYHSCNSVRPLEGRSAGLVSPAQWSQHSEETFLLISVILFCKNGFQSLSVPHIQLVKRLRSNCRLRLFDTEKMSLERRRADCSFSLGIVCVDEV